MVGNLGLGQSYLRKGNDIFVNKTKRKDAKWFPMTKHNMSMGGLLNGNIDEI